MEKVLAGDIKLPADVEIGNPEQIICHIDDPNFVLKMNFVVETGRGYLPIDKASADRLHSDMIALDAVLVQFFAYASRSRKYTRWPRHQLATAHYHCRY